MQIKLQYSRDTGVLFHESASKLWNFTRWGKHFGTETSLPAGKTNGFPHQKTKIDVFASFKRNEQCTRHRLGHCGSSFPALTTKLEIH